MSEEKVETIEARLSWQSGLWLAGVGALLAGMYWSVAGYFAHRWIDEQEYYHCLLVPVVMGWLLRRSWEDLRAAPRGGYTRGLWLLGAGLLLYVVSVRLGVRVAIGASFAVVLCGIVLAAAGPQVFRLAGPITALSFFLVPIPRHMLGHVGMPLQQACTAVAGFVGNVLGLQVAHQGVTLGMDGTSFVVAHACSGLNSLLALVFTTCVIIVFTRMPALRGGIVLGVLLPIVLIANSTRLVLVLLLAKFAGASFALGAFTHGASDAVVYLATLGGLMLLISVLSRSSVQSAEELEPEADRGATSTGAAVEYEWAGGGGN